MVAIAKADSSAGRRVALVIGNARYEPAVGALQNPVKDAKAVAKVLRGLGFAVSEEHNVTRDELWEALAGFRKRIAGSEVALFYYAGHGISLDGANYLVPVRSGYVPIDADAGARRLLAETRLFNADQVLAEMNAAGGACRLLILDACRNTPIAMDKGSRSGIAGAGLTEMRPPAGSLVAFATDAGRVASDGRDANGLYTSEWLKHLQVPGLTIEQVFKRTRAGVMERSGGSQVPVEYSRLIGEDIYLAGLADVVAPVASPPKAREVKLPSSADVNQLAAAGRVDECLAAMELRLAAIGPEAVAEAPLDALLELAKEELKRPQAASTHTREIRRICEKVLLATVEFLPPGHPRRTELAAKAQNRRGDCLLLEGEAEQALSCYEAAIALAPDDAYPLYNRGRVLRVLGRNDEARAALLAVADGTFNQPHARQLALAALAELDAANRDSVEAGQGAADKD